MILGEEEQRLGLTREAEAIVHTKVRLQKKLPQKYIISKDNLVKSTKTSTVYETVMTWAGLSCTLYEAHLALHVLADH